MNAGKKRCCVLAVTFHKHMLPAHDSAEGIHNALCRAFRAASYEKRLAVLCAHPDLAGKLAQQGELTQSSTQEQASAEFAAEKIKSIL